MATLFPMHSNGKRPAPPRPPRAARRARGSAMAFAPSEKEITAAVMDHWRTFGVPGSLVASIPNEASAGQSGLTKGLADLVVIVPGRPVGFLELKTMSGRLSIHQQAFAETCRAAGVPYAVAYGRDDPIELLEAWGAVRPRGTNVR